MPATPIYVGKAQFDGLGQGFSESYYLNGTDLATAKAKFLLILDARMAMLHEDFQCVFSTVTQKGKSRKAFFVPPTSTVGLLTDATMSPNRIQDSILIRGETGDGDFANRYIHGVPDKVVVGGVYTPDTGVGAWSALLTALETALTTNSVYLKKDSSSGSLVLSTVVWATNKHRGYAYHKCGRPFGQQRGRVLAG